MATTLTDLEKAWIRDDQPQHHHLLKIDKLGSCRRKILFGIACLRIIWHHFNAEGKHVISLLDGAASSDDNIKVMQAFQFHVLGNIQFIIENDHFRWANIIGDRQSRRDRRMNIAKMAAANDPNLPAGDLALHSITDEALLFDALYWLCHINAKREHENRCRRGVWANVWDDRIKEMANSSFAVWLCLSYVQSLIATDHSDDFPRTTYYKAHCARLYLEFLGHDIVWEPRWVTPTVRGLAQTLYNRSFRDEPLYHHHRAELPQDDDILIFADALEDAGASAAVLNRMRTTRKFHKGNYIVDMCRG